MRRSRNAKIIATLGPSSSSKSQIEKLFEAGADVFRLNFSHGSHEDHRIRYDTIREIEKGYKRPIGILMDLQGPKLRVGTFKDGSVTLGAGRPFRLDLSAKPGDPTRVGMPHPEIFKVLEPGMNLLMDDGKMRMKVMECGEDFADMEILVDGVLSDRKGVNVPDAVLPLSAMTDKDRKDLDFGLELGADWVALSFVQKPEDVAEAKKIVQGRAAVMAKLEKPSAIEHLEEIIELADGVMVARGDLGVEMPPEEVPVIQKQIISAARRMGKPVVVATQMLDSMMAAPAPTRAEASDVATAIYDGADTVMLSGETAAGDYPVEAVEMMDKIINRVEKDSVYKRLRETDRLAPEHTASDAISAAARQVAETLSLSAVVTYTTTGSTSLRASRERPDVPILGLTPRTSTARMLCLVWGIHAVETRDADNFGDMVKRAQRLALREGFGGKGDRLVITAGVPFGTPGATNILRIAFVE